MRPLDPAVAAVYITEELEKRAPTKTDYLQEKLALQELAVRMVEKPDEVLPRFVDLAMEMFGGVAAGLSLYEENPSPGVFRWRYLRGSLARFEGATTPRDFSPCGITLDQNRPVLTAYSERAYDWISNCNVILPEVLLVPLFIGSAAPLGTLWIVSDEDRHFDSGHARIATELAKFVGAALYMQRTEQRLKQALAEQEVLTAEMSHRIKNLFAMTNGMIRMSAKTAETPKDMAAVLSGRLNALSTAHALVRRQFDDIGKVREYSDLMSLMETILAPHGRLGAVDRAQFAITGPVVSIGDKATNGLALVFHELATNASKYGALKDAQGIVSVAWRVEEKNLTVTWDERGGPKIEAPPTRTGFGTILSRGTIESQMRGTLSYDWKPEGLSFTLCVPTNQLSS
jgi:two-component sensor histidine kinase